MIHFNYILLLGGLEEQNYFYLSLFIKNEGKKVTLKSTCISLHLISNSNILRENGEGYKINKEAVSPSPLFCSVQYYSDKLGSKLPSTHPFTLTRWKYKTPKRTTTQIL